MKAVVAAFNQEKALVGAFSVITNLRMELFQALVYHCAVSPVLLHAAVLCWADVTVSHVTRQKLRAMTARSPTLGPAASQQLSRSKQSD